MDCDLCLQYIKVRKLFKGGNYSRAETIRGYAVYPNMSQTPPKHLKQPIKVDKLD